MKKVAGLVLAAGLALGVLTVAGPAAADEEDSSESGGATVTVYYNDVQDEIIDVDLNNGSGFTYNTDTGDVQYYQQDEDGNWYETDPPVSSPGGIEADANWEPPVFEGGEE